MFSLYSICGFFEDLLNSLVNLWESTGLNSLFNDPSGWQNIIMLLISFILFYLSIVKRFEPLLLLPIAFGMFIVNIPGSYKILFGEKGYILTDALSNTEVARGTLEQILELFNKA
ncbi:MAG: sodium ion-translocating decarboxylase subunit beta, partial [Clostridia bacterium]|nr:sodium ion-translocating decarboxylase subunit beta [Clostridia bacterium]